ncbi:3-hydroxyacyl-CoA dehydrogenase [Fennellomyces sp. T-0311]|nr:3-hydroxyacyl-CoA dehydrogenase [Fennellomyces sp. T-0311]
MFRLAIRSNARLSHNATQAQKRFLTAPAADRNIDHIKRVGVIGSGQMGLGIAYVAANVSRLPVVLMDINKEQTDKGLKFMDRLLEKDVAKEKITAEHAKGTRELVSATNSLSNLSDVDIVIEAASENLNIKSAIFRDLDAICKPDAILATNTSSISITKIAAATKKAEKVIGMHFMNPVPVMKLVEVIPGLATHDDVLQDTLALAKSMGKTTTVAQDIPGFVANRLLMPYINEAVMLLESGVASAADIDTTMKLGTNMPMGPLTLADFIGLDTCLAIQKVLHDNTGDSKYRPSVLLQKYVDAGWYGKKSGRGFYSYSK